MSDTPKTDMAARRIGAAAARWQSGEINAVAFADAVDRFADAVAELERENAALRALISEPYGFFTFGHKALQPWGKALDNWCNRAKPLLENEEAKP
ncbi:MAG: hypothetical protein EBR82_10540 [Caulobacteraceae bacterium]|nr:hypothetical protein [Caulobacteraceae bacterium]